ncbi:MAG: multidrug transporter [Asgard group archaeon]
MKRFTTILTVRFNTIFNGILFMGIPLLSETIIILVATAISSLTYFLTPIFGKMLKKHGIVGIDLHKVKKTLIPECGGIVLGVGFVLFLSFLFVLTGRFQILYILTISLLFGLLGFIDDMVRLGKYEKLFCSILISTFTVSFLGLSGVALILGILFVIATANIFNLFAGLNGLEVGSSTIISFFFMTSLFILGDLIPGFITLGVFLILFSFLLHNKYPAKIFPGNVGTLLIGGFFASFTLYYNMYLILIPLLTLHIINSLLKGYSAGYFSFSEKKPTKVLKNGILKPRDDFLSFVRLLLKFRPMKELEIVRIIWAIQTAVGVLTTITISGIL